ncbi:hypothetical protein [Pleionea litopenaei]|uniref:Uncharacterized protein n=1 Tax=Pleionea litopenaei TaxID=3070815 RepID=A0AA51RSL6_9GAMM|nr:hypothetical protein [Pleionea sp. HL-JVS1]WMS86901.1 hypothetical protein Q9312_16925 [Pleionea sp. HL-JVS1]
MKYSVALTLLLMITISSLCRAELTHSSIQISSTQATDRVTSLAENMTRTLLDLANEKIQATLLTRASFQDVTEGKLRTSFYCSIEMSPSMNSRFANALQIRDIRNITVWRPIDGDAKEWVIVYF